MIIEAVRCPRCGTKARPLFKGDKGKCAYCRQPFGTCFEQEGRARWTGIHGRKTEGWSNDRRP